MAEIRVYASYAWKVEEQTKILDKLEAACSSHAIRILRDKNEIGYRESIQAYMNKLVAGDAIILVLSDAYFKSQYCMYELCEIYEHEDFLKRIYPIVTAGTRFHKAEERLPYSAFWDEKKKKLEKDTKDNHLENISGKTLDEIREYGNFARIVDKLLADLGDRNALTQDVHLDTDFAALIAQLKANTDNASLVQSETIEEVSQPTPAEATKLISNHLDAKNTSIPDIKEPNSKLKITIVSMLFLVTTVFVAIFYTHTLFDKKDCSDAKYRDGNNKKNTISGVIRGLKNPTGYTVGAKEISTVVSLDECGNFQIRNIDDNYQNLELFLQDKRGEKEYFNERIAVGSFFEDSSLMGDKNAKEQ